MNETDNSPICERASDLMAFLYNEASESERRDFELHLQQCRACRDEAASFGVVRESIGAWRDEALSGFVSMPVAPHPVKKSALAALRQFFDLSPLWLKAATAVAVISLFVLAGLAIVGRQRPEPHVTNVNPNAVYTEQDVNRIVKETLAKQANEKQSTESSAIVKFSKPKKVVSSRQVAKNRRPLSRAEREQLAADLRLLSTRDNEGLNLLGDRINQ